MNTSQIRLLSIILAASFFITTGCTTSTHNRKKDETEENVRQPLARSLSPGTSQVKSVAAVPMAILNNTMGNADVNSTRAGIIVPYPTEIIPQFQLESYNHQKEDSFVLTTNDPLSTFSIDVDTASYSNIRRFLQGGHLPPVGAVRIEEMINYFSYNFPEPHSELFSITTESGPCPWRKEHRLIRIGVKAKDMDTTVLPPSNLVFLIDVSGSMNRENKLGLVKKSLSMLVDQLDKKDRVAIVVYAGSDRIVLPPTSGSRKKTIKNAINNLMSGGVTHGSKGIITAYELAARSFMPGGNNRIILATDGDFNVGTTSRGELERLISRKRASGTYLTVLGFGMGNLHDDTMELLADRGNGNYSYIDSLLEAKKVLIKERAGTLFTLAEDVKIQVEFNPAAIGAYRLIGYENRALQDEDFNNDKKDAGEIGAGHRVTALYEIIPAGSKTLPSVDPLKYQTTPSPIKKSLPGELLTVKLRYKPVLPNHNSLPYQTLNSRVSKLLSRVLIEKKDSFQTTPDFRFTSAVAGFGLLLQHSEFAESLNYSTLLDLARSGKGEDREGYRAELIRLLEMAEMISSSQH
jgi:Ca-activated chloride channel family protein